MPCVPEGFDHLRALVKSSIVHDHNAAHGELWNQVLDHPCIKDLRIDGGGKGAHGEECATQKCPNDIGATLCTPILDAITSFASWGVPMGSWHVKGKPALVKGHDGFSCPFIILYGLAEDRSFFGIRLGVPEGFFYRSQPCFSKRTKCLTLRRPNALHAHIDRHQGTKQHRANACLSIFVAFLVRVSCGSSRFVQRNTVVLPIPKRFATSSKLKPSFARTAKTRLRKSNE